MSTIDGQQAPEWTWRATKDPTMIEWVHRLATDRAACLKSELQMGLTFAVFAVTKFGPNQEAAKRALSHAEVAYQSAILLIDLLKTSDGSLPEEINKLASRIESLREKIDEAKGITTTSKTTN
jgi:hypothetical protein